MFFPNHSSSKSYDDRYGNKDNRQSWKQNDRGYDAERGRNRFNYESYDNRDRGSRNSYERYEDDYYRDDTRKRRSRSPPRRRGRSPDPPSSKLILTSLPANVDRDILNIVLSKHGFNPCDVRVVKKNIGMGSTRSFGFIDFSTIEEAKEYMKYTHGVMQFEDGYETRIEFARENDPELANAKNMQQPSSDWFCAKCSINNFNRRSSCFKCGTSREESDSLSEKGYTYIGAMPTDTLLIRELPITADEYQVVRALASYTSVPIQRVQLSSSKKYCFVQLRSVEEANVLLNTFNRAMLQINGCTVMITFSRVSLNKILLNESVNAMRSQAGVSTSQLRADPANAAAMLAQNAIQLTKMGRLPDPHGRQSISTPLGVFPLYAHPDPRMFQMDSTTGYFYDPNGFYYDPNTGFYFNNTTQVWCFWCSKFSTYIPVQGSEPEMRKRLQIEERNLHAQNSDNAESSTDASAQKSEEAESEPTSKKSKKTDDPNKPKSALEIQKEMDRWAKKQAKMKKQKEEQQSAFTPVTKSTPTSDESTVVPGASQTSNARKSSTNNEVTAFNEQEYLDWTNLTCMLCERQFKSKEILEKHCQKSELHKKNTSAKIAELGQAASSLDQAFQYRDRAKERRSKFGLDPGLDDNVEKASSHAEPTVSEQTPLDDSNIGNRLLKNMGWSEGSGLGRNQQGIVNPIMAEQRVQGVGLGAVNSKATLSHKERLQQSTISRFNSIRD